MESSGFGVLDIVLLGVVLLSGLLALFRGFVHEVLSFGAWVGAALVALYSFPYLQPYARELISIQIIADVGAGAVAFLVALIVFSLIAKLVAHAVQGSSLSALDRTLGLVFGLVRGAVLISLAWLIFAWLVPEPQQPPWVTQAKSLPLVKQGAAMLQSLVPEEVLTTLGDTARQKLDTPAQPQDGGQGFEQTIQPQPKESSEDGQPAYNEGERQEMEKTIEGILQGDSPAQGSPAQGTGQQ